MFSVSLIISGIAMFLNGFLPLIDKNDNNEIVVMNVISGFLVTFLSIYGIFVSSEGGDYLLYLSTLLFAFTNLFISAICIWNLNEESFGWLCCLFTVFALGLGIYYLVIGNITFGVLWLIWMVLWLFYFLSRSFNILEGASNAIIMLEGILAMCGVGIVFLADLLPNIM